MSLAHFGLHFTRVSLGVGGAIWLDIVEICKLLAMSFICWACLSNPMGVSLWCMHRYMNDTTFCFRFNL